MQFADSQLVLFPQRSPTSPAPQGVWLTLGNVAPWRCWPTLSFVRPSPDIAVVLQLPHAHSISAHITGGQERPCIAAAVQLSGQGGFGGSGGKAKGRWLLRPPSIVTGRHMHPEGVGAKQSPCQKAIDDRWPPGVCWWPACQGVIGKDWPPGGCERCACCGGVGRLACQEVVDKE